MKKLLSLLLAILLILVLTATLTGCEDQADIVSQNLSQQADNFNVVRKITATSLYTNEIIFEMTGNLSIEMRTGKMDVIVEVAKGDYRKHYITLSEMMSITVEDLGGADVSAYNYTLNYNPKMFLPVNIETVD